MNEDIIQLWWEAVPKPKETVELIIDALDQSKIVVIDDAQRIPWAHEFKQIICQPFRDDGENQMYLSLDHRVDNITDPGEYLFKRFESESRKRQFRPFDDYPTFLGQSLETPLHQKLIWIKCLDSETQIIAWMNFIHFYTKERRKAIQNSHRDLPICRFVLELDSSLKKTEKYYILKVLFKENTVFTSAMDYLNNFTLHVFATLLLEKKLYSSKYFIKDKFIYYLADLAADLSDGNPELCSELLAQPRTLFNDPTKRYQRVMQNFPPEKLFSKANWDLNQIKEICWKNQVSHLFPIIEKIRQRIISKYEEEYSRLTPRIHQDTRKLVRPPMDLEIGTLNRFVSDPRWFLDYRVETLHIEYSEEDIYLLKLGAESRNDLAHLKVVPIENIKALLKWDED